MIPFDTMIARMRALGCDPIRLAREAGARAIRELPFVYVFGRSQFAISYFSANIFPDEMVSVGLEQPDLAVHVTGKFVMQVVADDDQNLTLTVAVELAPETSDSTLEDRIARSILAQLLRLDPEFAAYVPPERQRPRITLHAAGDPTYFPVGVKHRYSRG